MKALSHGHLEVALLMLDHTAGTSTQGFMWKTAVTTLITGHPSEGSTSYLSFLKFLLGYPVFVEDRQKFLSSSLITTIGLAKETSDYVSIAKLLIEVGVNVTYDLFLYKAAFWGNQELVELFLEKGSDLEETNAHGETALDISMSLYEWSIAKILFKAGANANHGGLLHRAVGSKDRELVELVLQRGANLEDVSNQQTALQYALNVAAKNSWSNNTLEIAKVLLKAGANIHHGPTLPQAISSLDLELVKLVLERGPDLEETDSCGRTALDCAVAQYKTREGMKEHLGITNLLIEHGAKNNRRWFEKENLQTSQVPEIEDIRQGYRWLAGL